MKKSVPSQVFCFVLFLCLVMCGIAPAEEVSVIDEDLALKYPIMHPDRQTLRRWMDQYNTAPKAHIDPEIAADLSDAELRGRSSSVNLLSHLKYTPSERNQGNCGDCWAWAGTGVMEIALHVQNNLKDRLSEQYFNSCEMWNSFGFSCCGGTQTDFADFYRQTGYAIPWSNTNASFQDGTVSYYCGGNGVDPWGWSAVSCPLIAASPKYPVLLIQDKTISTQGETQTQAIANIKNVLKQNKGVVFSFYLADKPDWTDFRTFFKNQGETDVWDPDPYCGHTYVDKEGGGHAVLVVGYDDSAPTPYWLVLNSWGAPATRPNGLFRMKMKMNYDCDLEEYPYSNPVRQFQTHDMVYMIPPSKPWAPLNVTAKAGSKTATVSFTAPDFAGGMPITSYTVVSNPDNKTKTGTSSPIAIGGLTNGKWYTFTVKATNALGTGPASAASNTVLPATVPDPPMSVHATGGNAQAKVSFNPPAFNGGTGITSYTVYASPGGIAKQGWNIPITVTGLTNGTAYTFTVKATNSVGTGAASAPSNAVIPATVPNAPTGVNAKGGNGLAWVTFIAPSSNGGGPLLSYTVTSKPDGITKTVTTNSAVLSGLTNGTAYTFTVTAANALGSGPASAPSNSVTPAAPPGAPTNVQAAAYNKDAVVTFTAPSNGGSPITSYMAISSPGNISKSAASSPITVTGLTNGTTYTFKVKATNAVGAGPMSAASNSVKPANVPEAPTGAHATWGDGQATVSFSPPAGTASVPITSYTVTSNPGNISKSGAASPIIVTGLTNGTTYTFTVTANNTEGSGPPSAPSNSVIPRTTPGVPTNVQAAAGDKKAWVTFTPPASGGSPIIKYTVTSSTGGIVTTGTASPITVTGLTNGTAYTFTVTASNAVGTGSVSSPSNSITPGTIPGAPTGVQATAGNAQATVTFSPPASDGWNPITSYSVTSTPGGIIKTGTGSPITVTGLTNGTAYTFKVKAFNAIGTGPDSSPSNSVTPKAR